MAKIEGNSRFWAESALQVIFHMDTLCSLEQGRGVWVSSTAIKVAMKLKTFGSYHISAMQSMVDDGLLEHRPGASFKPHQYKLTDDARRLLVERFTSACTKCQIEK